ncbi:MAG: hypothetical protein AMS15_00080 [Planctomycetes bacterium DG_23]|nr:MAG: hypothetical protein AMS15_00080 [Planctomycetes bacterium DG_23]
MDTSDAIDIGSRLELLVDDYLIDQIRGKAELRLHHPHPQEVVLVTDKPWEGCMCGNITVFRDGHKYRMYYKAFHTDVYDERNRGEELVETHPLWIAYAESDDGLHWQRPELGLVEFEGSKKNNLIWQGVGPEQHGVHGFAPFKDENPDCAPDARYKAVGGIRRAIKGGLYGMKSPDGIHWSLLEEEPIITKGRFDSQNLAFWDRVRGEYRAYVRDLRENQVAQGDQAPARHRRDIRTATSKDFIHWSEPVWLEYPGAPDEELYTNQIQPYYRAPHILVGFPTRYVRRPWSPAIEALPELEHRRIRAHINERFGAALTDGLFMSSRNGRTFKRWAEAFVRPGPQVQGNWAYGDNYQCWGMLETPSALEGAPEELSFYVTEGYWRGNSTYFRRYTLRIDGFVSMHAPLSGGEFVTRPLIFGGGSLVMNFSTSAAGSMRVEIQNSQGRPLQGFTLDDCHEIIGDELERIVEWKKGNAPTGLAGKPTGASGAPPKAGKPIRLHFVMKDADLYSFRFREAD